MFSIAAINDTDSKQQWEPLAPTKEAQEFHLTQTYHQGLLKLQAKEFDEARELLESVLKDPLIANAQVDNRTSDGHLLQLRLLALKNLATVFLQQGSAHYKSALHCYLQAVEIDTKDSVVWNQLGTLSCSMGLLGMSRWAFEQGLICSPNNWNCMEKLLEVLIAIGDEVACLSIAELILTRWPSHARALHVKRTIEESEPDPCAPRGIDKLEPKHVRLKFLGKRTSTDESHEDAVSCKILNRNIELRLLEVSWAAFTDALLEVLHSLHGCGSDMSSANEYWSGDIRVNIRLPSSSDIIKESKDYKETTLTSDCSSEKSYVNEREANTYEEQPHERRSTRLERLRSRKPGKEEFDSPASKELGKVIIQFLEPFMACKPESEYSACTNDQSASQHDNENAVDTERKDVCAFVIKTSKNYGVYHMGHLLLEYAAESGLLYQDTFSKLLELERLTRDWGQDRTAECSLFLAELYYDIGSLPSNSSNLPEFMSLASYHLCKIIELVALEFPFCLSQRSWIESCSSAMSFKDNINMLIESQASFDEPSVFSKQISFWVRYFWLSGKLSLMESNKPKAQEDFYFSMSILVESERKANSPCPVYRPHVKADKELTVNRIMHEINMLKVDVLLQKAVDEMLEKELYLDCINLLAPLLFSSETFHLAVTLSPDDYGKGQGFTCIELSAINILIKACEKTKSTHGEVHLNAHRWKLQILMSLAGLDNYKQLNQKSLLKGFSASSGVSEVNTDKDWVYLVAEEVKEISQCASQLKNLMDPSNDLVGNTFPTSIIFDIQSLLVAVMCHVAISFSRKPSLPAIANETDEKLACCFVDAGIAFCKLQHLVPSIDIKTQVELIKAVHDLLAEYGLCCAGKTNEGEEGAFLKFAIKHLLALDMKLKPIFNSSSTEMIQVDVQLSNQFPNSTSTDGTKSDVVNVDIGQKGIDEVSVTDNNIVAGVTSKCVSSSSSQNKDDQSVECGMQCSEKGKDNAGIVEQLVKSDNVLDEEEKEELEMIIDNALDQCFFCLYGLNLRSDSLYEDDLSMHKNTSRGDYQTKEQCADVFQYILPYAKASSKTGLVKLRRVLRAIRKHFPQPPEDVLAENLIDTFLDDPELCEDKLSEEAGSEGYLDTITRILFSNAGSFKQHKACILASSEPYADVYFSLYYFLALSEEMSATDKWPGFVLTKEGEEFVQQNAKLFKYDLLYNPLRYESWQRLAKIYDEEVDLLLNDGSKHINVSGWRKNADLPVRVDASRRRSRRCLLMSLALAKTSDQQCEVHELLALVYYDSLQNVVPFYDQRSFLPSKDLSWKAACEKSLKHFKKAFSHKKDWSHAFYMGKLCEKLGCLCETPLLYYNEAIALNPSAVDPFYRMHASRLKLLCKFGKQDLRALKVVSEYSFSQPLKDDLMSILSELAPQQNVLDDNNDSNIWEESKEKAPDEDMNLERAWHMLYNDCLSALEICVEGDLKHFHKARYMLAQGFYKRNLQGDLEKAKEELSFSFKSYRSSFTINLWEIDGMVKKGRRKTPGLSGSKRALEVNLPESSRKFITCIRKYLMFYLKLLEETEDICTLDRAFLSLRTDKRFSLCIEDLVPVAFGRYVKALKTTMCKPRVDEFVVPEISEHQLEKLFTLFTEHGNLWGEIFSVPELSGELSENSLYGYLHEYIDLLERNINLETLESMNEKIRKRFKNPKLSNSNCAKVCRHSSAAWCRSLIVSLALITPVQHENPTETRGLPLDGGSEYTNLLFIDLQTTEFWSSLFDDSTHMEDLVVKWSPVFTKIKSTMIRKASDENFETATRLLRSSYNFYRESSSVTLPSCVNLYLVPSHLAKAMHFQPGVSGIEQLDMSIPRKLLLWAYVLLNGHYTNISAVVKHCEENLKQSKVKKGSGTHVQSTASTPSAITLHTDGKDGNSGGKQSQTTPVKDESTQRLDSLQRPADNQKNSFMENRSSATEG